MKLIIVHAVTENLGIITLETEKCFGAQIVYQLSHELTHYYFFSAPLKVNRSLSWLEETLCELASELVLYKLSLNWSEQTKYFVSVSNRKSAQSYLKKICDGDPFATVDTKQFYDNYAQYLSINFKNREINTRFALSLFFKIKDKSLKTFWKSIYCFFNKYDYSKSFKQNIYLGDKAIKKNFGEVFGVEPEIKINVIV